MTQTHRDRHFIAIKGLLLPLSFPAVSVSKTKWSVSLVMSLVTMTMWSVADFNPISNRNDAVILCMRALSHKGGRATDFLYLIGCQSLFQSWSYRVHVHCLLWGFLSSSSTFLFLVVLSDLHLGRWFICQNVGRLFLPHASPHHLFFLTVFLNVNHSWLNERLAFTVPLPQKWDKGECV